MAVKSEILSKEVAQRKLQRMALEIAEQLSGDAAPLVIIGIAGSGMVIAQKIFQLLQPLLTCPLKIIACTLNKKEPTTVVYSEPADFNAKNILIVDDVINSGKTILYALKPLLEFYPKQIQILALVERMHKHFPVNINYIGLSVATTLQDHIQVEVEGDEITGAYIV